MDQSQEILEPSGHRLSDSRPDIPADEEIRLWVRSGGRCAFCNKYLLQDEYFIYSVRVGEMAHIVGWKDSKRSPRGKNELPLAERNRESNLMLLCAEHHQLIDKNQLVDDFPVERLRKLKEEHEDRVYHLTGMGADRETAVVRLLGNVRGTIPEVSPEHAREVVFSQAERYARFPFVLDRQGIEVNLAHLPSPETMGDAYWSAGKAIIDQQVSQVNEGTLRHSVRHISVFALARIPLLMYFGYRLDDKVPTDFYQKHRGTGESWLWPEEDAARFEWRQLRTSETPERVALILSLSGTIHEEELPEEIDASYNIFEIIPTDKVPGRDVMRARASLEAFTRCYHDFLSQLEVSNKPAQELSVFPAVPVSAALVCGRGIMRDAQPELKIYDRVGSGFQYALTVNER